MVALGIFVGAKTALYFKTVAGIPPDKYIVQSICGIEAAMAIPNRQKVDLFHRYRFWVTIDGLELYKFI
jgi:hypothetical protein